MICKVKTLRGSLEHHSHCQSVLLGGLSLVKAYVSPEKFVHILWEKNEVLSTIQIGIYFVSLSLSLSIQIQSNI